MARVTALFIWTIVVLGPVLPSVEAATVRDLVVEAQAAARNANLATRNGMAFNALELAVETLRNAQVLDEDIRTFVGRYISPDAVALARRREERYTSDIKSAIDTIKQIANVALPSLNSAAPTLDKIVLELQDAQLEVGLEWNLETLRRLERKYGPGSAKLNGLEVVVAYSLQRVPLFGVNKEGRPDPLEIVLAYSPSYISRSDEQMRLIGVAEVGLRQYFFAGTWGANAGVWSWVRPAYASYGLAWAGASDNPLTPPWRGASRLGAFVGWGKLKVAWLGGDNQRFLVTQQFQLVPWVF